MNALIFIILLAAYVKNQPASLSYIVAIQIQSQYYFSYLPLIQTCSYPNTSIIAGQIDLVPINKKNIFARIDQIGVLEFWGPVHNGPEIAVALDIQSTQFLGYILYNSPEKDLNRPIIFFDITDQSGLMFYFTLVTINKQTFELNFNIIDEIQVQLSQQAEQLIMNCSAISTYNFAYLGNSSFMFACGDFAKGFIFDPWLGANSTSMQYFQTQIGNYKLAPDPTLMIDYHQIYTPFWNAVLLIEKGQIFSQLFFLIYNGVNITMESTDDQNKTLQLIINKLWGQQASVQFERLMDLYSSLKIQPVYFPGEIASIFISPRQNIFVQSVTPEGQTYLCVFNSRGQIQWNITFNGSVIYFGNQITLIYSYKLKVFYKVEVTRPIYVINPSDFSDLVPSTFNSFNFILPCQSVNITINYQIYWSTISYPCAYFQMLQTNPMLSQDSTYAVQTLQKFLIIGPAIEIIPSPPEGLEVYIINYKNVVIHSKTVAVFSMQKYSDNIEGIMLVTSNSIFYVTTRGKVITLVSQPCGFNSIVSAQLSSGSSYCTLTNSDGQVCLCQPNYMVCSLVAKSQFETQTSTQSPKNSTNKTNASSINRQNIGNQSFLIKKTFLNLIERNIIVSILQNNTVVIFDLLTMKPYEYLFFECNAQNLTNGIIFIKEFFSPTLILFCEGSNTISQFIIRYDQFVFQRVIPLYGFQTISDLYSIQQTSSFIFLSVNPIDGVYIQSCCVLRIDPEKFTASAIVQVIFAEYLVSTATYINYDFVVVSNITDNGLQTIIKIYIPNEWISFNQTNNTQLVTQYQDLIFCFSSPIYNFFSYMFLQITFNLSRADLILLTSDEQPQTIIFHVLNKSRVQQYQYILSYNMSNFICGPIFNSYIKSTDQNVLVQQTDTLIRLKLIGSVGIVYIQLINPEHWNQPNFTLNNLLLFVSINTMYVYAKYLNNTQMVQIDSFTLPQNQCSYYLYQILNSSAASLTSNCNGVSFKLQTPLLTINYDISKKAHNFTHSSTYMQIPKALRDLQTINVNSSYVLVLGVIEGPTYSPSGRLVICHQQICSYLFISSNLQFLLDYSTFSGTNNTYFVMAIGIATIDVFINPIPNNNTYITPNYTISYSQQIKQAYCSVIKILNATQTYSIIILSGTKFYYYISINFTTNQLKVLQKFQRYSQCNLFDQFEPSCIYENQTLFMLMAECRQNGYKTTLDFYVGAKSSAIYTGYLQVFTFSGPLGSSCDQKSLSTIRIVPLSTSMYFPIFITYKVENVFKFIYSSIDGFLIDNRLQFIPQVRIVFIPSQYNYTYPILDFYVYNQFHFESEIIQTDKTIAVPQKKYPLYILIILISMINLVTLIFLISYYFIGLPSQQRQEKIGKKQDSQYFQSQNSLNESLLNPSQYSLEPNEPLSSRMSEITTKSRPYELELFFMKFDSESLGKKTI